MTGTRYFSAYLPVLAAVLGSLPAQGGSASPVETITAESSRQHVCSLASDALEGPTKAQAAAPMA